MLSLRNCITSLGLILFFGSLHAQTNPATTHYEPFDYAAFNPLFNLSGGDGWAGPWIREKGDDAIIRRGNLDAPGLALPAGTRAAVEFVRDGIRYNRAIERIADGGQELWISVLMDFLSGSAANNVGNITLTNNGNQVFTFGRKFGSRLIGLAGPGVGSYNSGIRAEGLHWFVVRIKFSGDAGREDLHVWVDPDPNQEPQLAEATLAVPAFLSPGLTLNNGFDNVQLKVEGSPPLSVHYDEFRMAGSFSGVRPVETVSLCPDRDELGITFFGSSVARGQGAPGDRGYAFRYGELLEERAAAGLGPEWQTTNISVGGDNTTQVAQRYQGDLIPRCGSYVVYGLSLANEGIRNGGQRIYDQFRDNLTALTERARTDGITPVIMGNYPRGDYDAEDYQFIKDINLYIHQMDAPSVNLLGSVDDGNGRWALGYEDDPGHPNLAGHTEFFHAMVPSLFDALREGKPAPVRDRSTFIVQKGIVDAAALLTVIPEDTLHAFTYSISLRTGSEGYLARLVTDNGEAYLNVNPEGKFTYTSATGEVITGTETVTDESWHTITLTHYYARGETILYTDSTAAPTTLSEQMIVREIETSISGFPTADFRELFLYRSGMNADEVRALVAGKMLKGSLEIYAPLYGSQPADSLSYRNLARSTNTLAFDFRTGSSSPESINQKQYRVYPNPTADVVRIERVDGKPVNRIALYDAAGREIYIGPYGNALSLERQPAGTYSLIVTDRQGMEASFRVVRR